MEVCVVGGGVIGSLLAAHLSLATPTKLLVRRTEHAAAVNGERLEISGIRRFTADVRASTVAADLRPCDMAIVATKSTDLPSAAEALEALCPSCVMTVQNGLGAEHALAQAGAWPVISGVTFLSGTRLTDREIELELDAPTWLAPWHERPAPLDAVQRLAELLCAGGLMAELRPDLRPAQWSKLLFNSAVSTTAAITELPHVSAYTVVDGEASLGGLIRALMDEGRAVARAAGVRLADDPWQMNLAAVARGRSGGSEYHHLPSILADVRARRPTEVDFITGAVLAEARRLEVPARLHEMAYELIKGKEASWLKEDTGD